MRKSEKPDAVLDVDDLYDLLTYHWVSDSSRYRDERQRVQVATGLLLSSFVGCRPCSLFDTRLNTVVTAQESAQARKNRHNVSDVDSDGDTDEDDRTGSDITGAILYRHVELHIVPPDPQSQKENHLFAKITLVHTKGDDNRKTCASYVLNSTHETVY